MNYKLIAPPSSSTDIIKQILSNRGITDIEHFLNTTDDDILDPCLLSNIQEGAKMLLRHIYNNDKTLIVPDVDADGFTSAAVLINFLYKLFPSFVQNNIEYKINEGKIHGIVLENIPDDIKFVIMPDSASSDYEQHRILAERGIDILILDHHPAEKESENACVINNQLCDYPTKSLSGVGIVYKFCSYLDSVASSAHAENFLDLVALGLIADVMDYRDFETKHLISKGLKQINNPFFKTLCKKNGKLGSSPNPIAVAWYAAPYVNATIRVGDADEKLLLFESMLDFKAYKEIPSTKRGCKGQTETIVEQACRNCVNIKKKQTDTRDASLKVIEKKINQYNLLENKIIIVLLEEKDNINKNVLGLIANQLMAKYQKPVMLLNEGENEWSGSCRGVNSTDFPSFKEFLINSTFVEWATGHDNAFGAGLKRENISKLIQFSNNKLSEIDFSPCYKVDFIFQGSDFQGADIIKVAQCKSIWGTNVEEPYFAIENIKIDKNNIVLMAKDTNPTLKITLDNGVCLIKFKSSEEEYESLYSELGCVIINIVGKCEINEWCGRITPQIIIESYSIVNKIPFYF